MKKLLLFTLISLISITVISQSCLPEGITFTTQEQIDNFQTDYPGCTEIEGYVLISGNDISNLNGLSVLTYISGVFVIGVYDASTELTSLEGLDNLDSIGGHFLISGNSLLMSLEGLSNLTSIGGTLDIEDNNSLLSLSGLDRLVSIGGYLNIWENFALNNLTALENVTNIGGGITIFKNYSLTSLEGLENIEPTSIEDLTITDNTSLSNCDVQSICDYLIAPYGEIQIENNAPGCNSQEEVEEACASSINEISTLYGIKTQPNPFTTLTTLSYELKQPEKVTLSIYNHLGQIVYQTQENQSQGNQQLLWNASGYPEGVYYYRLKVGDAVSTSKMVKVR